ncbi:MAG: hypothetical protein EAY65_04795 [Alphaproteobacteria bacterium]|nr:MAG: hypothetical protein EAY65_04795 [Alphaproteobacteria bacterium]
MKKLIHAIKKLCIFLCQLILGGALGGAILFLWFYIPAKIQGRAHSLTKEYSSAYEQKILRLAQQEESKIYFEDIFNDFEWDAIARGRCIDPESTLDRLDTSGCTIEFPILADGDYEIAYPFDNFYTSPHLHYSIHYHSREPLIFLNNKDKKAKLMYVFPEEGVGLASHLIEKMKTDGSATNLLMKRSQKPYVHVVKKDGTVHMGIGTELLD